MRVAIALAAWLVAAGPKAAADDVALSLPHAIQAARDTDAGRSRAQSQVAEAMLNAKAWWNPFLPDLSVGTALAYAPFGSGESDWTSTLTAAASLSLSRGAQIDRRQSAALLHIAQLELQQVDAAVAQQVRRSYFNVLLAERRITLSERTVVLADQELDQVQTLFEQGRASELALLEARSASIRARPPLNSARQALVSDLATLKRLTGLEPTDTVRLQGSIQITVPPADLARVMSSATELSPQLAAARVRVTLAELELREQAVAVVPPVLSAGYSYTPSTSPPFDDASDPDVWRSGTLSLRMTLPITPLLPQSGERVEHINARRAVDRARTSVQEAEEDLLHRVAELGSLVELSNVNIGLLQEAEQIAERRYLQTLQVYESGGVELLDVENARAAWEQSGLDLVRERHANVLRIVDLDALVGGSLLD